MPAAISAAVGAYVALSVVALGAKLPVPEEVQRPPVAPPPIVPPRGAEALLEQIVWLPAEEAVAGVLMVSTAGGAEVADGLHAPLTMTRYWLPFSATVVTYSP